MDNVNFQCGNCGNLMAVSPEALGQQVRCPHCQQVVLAPAPPPAPVANPPTVPAPSSPPPPLEELPEPAFQMPAVSELESIFAAPDTGSDALFDDAPRGLVELPTEPLSKPVAPISKPEPTLSYHPDHVSPSPPDRAPIEPEAGAFALAPTPGEAAAESTTSVMPDALAQAIPKLEIHAPVDKSGRIIAMVLIPLISYSILATVAVIYLRFFQTTSSQPHPLEMIPDVEGENPGVKKVKKRVMVDFHGRQELKVPSYLRLALGETMHIGDLEVTPTAVELRPIAFLMPGKQPEMSERKSLVLHLHLKNVSKDLAFCPLDPYFVRAWREVPGESKAGMPFTYLEAGRERFYGGPIALAEREERHESIRGQKLEHELMPDEEMDSFVCTDPELPVEAALQRATRPLLWRVQVRRGLVKTPSRGEVAASAVIGVEFTRDDLTAGAEEL
jgi:hypothetical protein